MTTTLIRRSILHVGLLFASLLLTGCFGPQTPEEAAADFWQAVISNDAEAVVETSTLDNPEDFDGFDRNWNGYQPAWGKVIIDGDEARIETILSAPGKEDREVTTWLVQQDEDWLVDYKRTARSASGGLFGNLFNRMSELGRELGDSFNQSAEEANRKLDQLLTELEDNQAQLSQEADKALEAYSAQLQQSLRAMDESIQQTLQEQGKRLSEEEKRTLENSALDLQQRLESMDPDSLSSALEDSKALAEIRDTLEKLDTEVLEKQKEQWQEISETLTKKIEAFKKEMMAQEN